MDKREKFLKELTERLLTSDVGFVMKEDDKNRYYTQVLFGKVKLIYAEYEFYSCPKQLQLAAIVTEGKVYIMSEYDLAPSFNGISLPENVISFYEYSRKLNEKIFNEVIKKLYMELPSVPLDYEKEKDCEERARCCLINGEKVNNRDDDVLRKIYHPFKFPDIFMGLSGYMNLEEEAEKRFRSKEERYLEIKSFNNKLREIIENNPDKVTEKWERELAKALTDTMAKKVNVEFRYHGKTASEKMTPQSILNILCRQDYFSDYNFVTSRNGDNLVRTLGAGRYKSDKNETLTCKHIEKITYGRKILYKRGVNNGKEKGAGNAQCWAD